MTSHHPGVTRDKHTPPGEVSGPWRTLKGNGHQWSPGGAWKWLRWLVIMSTMNPMATLRALRPVPIFRALAKPTLFNVARRTSEVVFASGATVVREGDAGDALYIIVEGSVEVRKGGQIVAQMTAGDFFGEISLLDGEPRTATIVAVDDVVLLTLKSSDFEELLKIHYVARTALESLAKRLREAHDSPSV